MTNTLFNALLALILPPVAAWGWSVAFRVIGVKSSLVRGWISSAACVTIANVIDRSWLAVGSGGLSLAVALVIWWWRRKDRKRAAKALGYKARALVAALVQRAREAAQPRPVLQPQRQAS